MALNAILHRQRSSWWQRLQQTPCFALAQALYAARQRVAVHEVQRLPTLGVTVVCISDTHNMTPQLPPGDLLIHAGDLTQGGTEKELQTQLDWLNAQPHEHKLVIAGNHDLVLDSKKSEEVGMNPLARQSLRWGSVVYLERSTVRLSLSSGQKLSIFGHPSTRKHGNWAFQYDRDTDAFTHQIEEGIDILVTHSAPRFHLDVAGWGDAFLLRELWRVRPRLHVYGHIHEGHGKELLMYDDFEHLYEQVCAGHAVVFALLHMIVLLLKMLLPFRFNRKVGRTVLVNASMVGGLLDADPRVAQVVRL